MKRILVIALTLGMSASVHAQNAIPVTVDNFARAETDRYLTANAKEAGGLGKFHHAREPASIDNQTVIRLNRDTLYSFAVVDLAAGPVTVTLPDAGKRFMSIMVVNQDHYVPFVAYDTKAHTLTEKDIGTRYAFVAVRTLVDPNDPKDVDTVHKLQDAIKITQKEAGKLELRNWDEASLTEVRKALEVLARHSKSFSRSFGRRDQVDPHPSSDRHRRPGGAAIPTRMRVIRAASPAKNDGKSIYKLNVPANVPVDAFWSVSLYNSKGYFEKNSIQCVLGEQHHGQKEC